MEAADLRDRLAALVAEHDVPGAALGVLHDGEVTAVAAGVANLRSGVEATPDTVFQIGSQGKMWTATVLMQLVDEGLVDIDAPVRTYLPGLSCRRSGRLRGGHAAPSALAHERHRRRPLRRLRPRRRLPRALRRVVLVARADSSARRHDVVLQHRLLGPRSRHRGRHRKGLGRSDARAAVRAARLEADQHAARGGDHAPGRRRPHQAVTAGRDGGGAGLDAPAGVRPDGTDQLDGGRRADVRPPAPRRRSAPPTAPSWSLPTACGRCRRRRWRAPTATRWVGRTGASA